MKLLYVESDLPILCCLISLASALQGLRQGNISLNTSYWRSLNWEMLGIEFGASYMQIPFGKFPTRNTGHFVSGKQCRVHGCGLFPCILWSWSKWGLVHLAIEFPEGNLYTHIDCENLGKNVMCVFKLSSSFNIPF